MYAHTLQCYMIILFHAYFNIGDSRLIALTDDIVRLQRNRILSYFIQFFQCQLYEPDVGMKSFEAVWSEKPASELLAGST